MKTLKSLNNKDIILDDSDYEYYSSWNWGINSSGYARRTHYDRATKKQRTLLLHKDITGTDRTQEVDHINGNRLDNRKSNLRVATKNSNIQRKATKRSIFTTIPYLGIEPDPKAKELIYYVRITYKGVRFNFGGYSDPKHAAMIYDAAALFIYGEYSRLNFEANRNKDRGALKSLLLSILEKRMGAVSSNSIVRTAAAKQFKILKEKA